MAEQVGGRVQFKGLDASEQYGPQEMPRRQESRIGTCSIGCFRHRVRFWPLQLGERRSTPTIAPIVVVVLGLPYVG